MLEIWGINMIMSKYRNLRKQAGYKTKEVADILEINICTLRKIERGQVKPSPLLKLKISILYKCDISKL